MLQTEALHKNAASPEVGCLQVFVSIMDPSAGDGLESRCVCVESVSLGFPEPGSHILCERRRVLDIQQHDLEVRNMYLHNQFIVDQLREIDLVRENQMKRHHTWKPVTTVMSR